MSASGQRRSFAEPSPDHFIRAYKYRLRDGDTERLGGLEVDDEVEPVDLLDRQGSGIGAQEDALDVLGREAADRVVAHAVTGKRPLGDALLVIEHRWQLLCPRGFNDPLCLATHPHV